MFRGAQQFQRPALYEKLLKMDTPLGEQTRALLSYQRGGPPPAQGGFAPPGSGGAPPPAASPGRDWRNSNVFFKFECEFLTSIAT